MFREAKQWANLAQMFLIFYPVEHLPQLAHGFGSVTSDFRRGLGPKPLKSSETSVAGETSRCWRLGIERAETAGEKMPERVVVQCFPFGGSGSKNRYQNGTLVCGNMDQHLRNPRLFNIEPHPFAERNLFCFPPVGFQGNGFHYLSYVFVAFLGDFFCSANTWHVQVLIGGKLLVHTGSLGSRD